MQQTVPAYQLNEGGWLVTDLGSVRPCVERLGGYNHLAINLPNLVKSVG
jgi:hypothetical protein